MDQLPQIDGAGAELLPAEVEEMLRLQREEKIAKIEAFGTALAKKRDDAVDGRKASGIEEEWWSSEEQYQGIDDANRDEVSGSLKPTQLGGSFIGKPDRKDTRSTVYLNITRPYVDAASAKVADMLLPNDDRNWGIKPTPIPSLLQAAQDQRPVAAVAPQPQGQPGMAQMPPGQPQMPAAPRQPTVADLARAEIKKAEERAEAAEKRIEDWLIECQYHAEVRKVIEDCARLGTGILKGPFPEKRTRKAMIQGPHGVAMEMEIAYAPSARRIDPWNFYPDPACGEDIHKGAYVWEKDELTARQLKDLLGVPGYLDDQIKKVLEEGPGKRYENARNSNQRVSLSEKEKFEVWYFSGTVDAEELELLDVEVPEGTGGAYALVTMVNDTPIKGALQPLTSGKFEYHLMPWQRKTGVPWGSGVAHHVRTPQRIVNAGVRNMMDNAGVSAGGQYVMRRDAIEPADGSWNITPRKIWFVRADADARSVNDVFATIQLPSMQAELMSIIQFAMKMAEDVTGLPQLLQGMQGQAPDTVGGMTMLQNNASSVLRRIARQFDDHITEPFIRQMYEWLLEYGEDENEKGDFTIDARGSTTLVERDIAQQAIMAVGQFVMNPAFELSPSKWIREALKAQRIDPKRLELDEEEKAKMAQQQPAPPPQVMAAQIRAQTEMQKTQMELQAEMQRFQAENQTDQMRIQKDTDRDTVYVQAEMARSQAEHQARMQELQVKRELAMLEYANKRQMALEDVKASLAETALKLKVQKELAAADQVMAAKQVATPAVEPPGRAPNGQAFQH